jgi:methylenetetrahydrofolate reductase (NADPH)
LPEKKLVIPDESGDMKIRDLFDQKKRVLSFELSAPRDNNIDGLFRTVGELKKLMPDYISITYGAGGSSRDMTYGIAVRLKEVGALPLMHFTCVGHSRSEIKDLLNQVKAAGIENILALRGDPPKGQTSFVPAPDGFRYANELIEFIRSEGYDFCLGIAGYPEGHSEAKSLEEDIQNLKRKIDAGGEYIITQLYFDNRDYFKYVERLRAMGITLPIQPGIWLLTDYAQTQRICNLCGAKIPEDVVRHLESIKDDKEKVTQFGIDLATGQCEELLRRGAPGIHFYVLNKSHVVQAVLENLKNKGFFFN